MRIFLSIALGLMVGATTLIGIFTYYSWNVDWDIVEEKQKFGCAVVYPIGYPKFVSAEYAAGEALFKANCASCHKLVGRLVGPQLAGIAVKHADDMDWLYAWVKNSSKLIKKGDPRAVALFEQYDKQQMVSFPMLTDEDIDAILEYADAVN